MPRRAWLIVSHIDRDATFSFVDDDVPVGATAFDMVGVALSHHGDDCTFETMLRVYGLDDPVLWDVARIVHEADLADDRYVAPEAVGLDAVCRGLTLTLRDEEILAVTHRLFNGLYEYRRRVLLLGQRAGMTVGGARRSVVRVHRERRESQHEPARTAGRGGRSGEAVQLLEPTRRQ